MAFTILRTTRVLSSGGTSYNTAEFAVKAIANFWETKTKTGLRVKAILDLYIRPPTACFVDLYATKDNHPVSRYRLYKAAVGMYKNIEKIEDHLYTKACNLFSGKKA